MAKKHKPYIHMQEDEDDAVGDCGCVLERGDDGPLLRMCQMHEAAPELLEMLARIDFWLSVGLPQQEKARVSVLRDVRAILIKVKGPNGYARIVGS